MDIGLAWHVVVNRGVLYVQKCSYIRNTLYTVYGIRRMVCCMYNSRIVGGKKKKQKEKVRMKGERRKEV